ncbi:MAG: D-xylose ABC transporter ATP-binding protein [Candidatus Rokuibacteriota bacterium]|nr:MAG: D-xylose ABC transporter ATP-binding protein [Candidatus Rokubacteria bacterium]
MAPTTDIIELEGITKRFPGVLALDGVDLAIRRGEVHVLVGQNGAGKSTLVKLLCGVYAPDQGRIRYEGAPYAPRSTLDAMRAGVRVVYQEFNLLPFLSVAENVYFERLPRRFGIVDFPRLYRDTEAMLEEVGLAVSPRARVETLGVAQMQLLEIAKALSSQSKVLVLDEPTATLTPREIHRLFEIIARLRARGVTILYISHRLQELFDVGDRITVLRNGRKVETLAAREATIPQLVKRMVGKELGEEYPFRPEVRLGRELLRVEGLRHRASPHPVSFAVRAGELVGVAGLIGAGRTETMRALFGADPKLSGRIYRDGREIAIERPRDAVRHGVCLLTEDRKAQGLLLDMPCYVNVTLTDLARVARGGLLQGGAERSATSALVKELSIRTPSVAELARNLSGGNQQKLVIAKWLFRRAEVLVCDEPTRGIDVGARYEIYNLLWRLAAEGKAILIVSSDLPELMGICHRILVFSNGRITGEVPRGEFGEERILALAYREHVRPGAAPTG